jgi:hypothetical protein
MQIVHIDIVSSWVVLGVCLGYGIACWLVGAFRSEPPANWLDQRILWLLTQMESDPAKWPGGEAPREALREIRAKIQKPWILLSVSEVQSSWRYVHGVEDDHIPLLPADAIAAQLETARTRLASIPGAEAKGIVARIDAMLKPAPADPTKPPPAGADEKEKARLKRARLLQEAQTFRHNYNDTNYENLAGILGKAVWLTWVALALVVALGVIFDRETFFLLGAAGALISRLSRVLERKPNADDYGAEWSTLLLAPAAGALAGWIGVALLVALAGDPFNVVTDSLAKPWDDALAPLGLAVAFVFGFSERLFNRLLGTAQATIGQQLPAEEGTS